MSSIANIVSAGEIHHILQEGRDGWLVLIKRDTSTVNDPSGDFEIQLLKPKCIRESQTHIEIFLHLEEKLGQGRMYRMMKYPDDETSRLNWTLLKKEHEKIGTGMTFKEKFLFYAKDCDWDLVKISLEDLDIYTLSYTDYQDIENFIREKINELIASWNNYQIKILGRYNKDIYIFGRSQIESIVNHILCDISLLN